MDAYNKMLAILMSSREDIIKFYANDNRAAGIRVRKKMQEIKALAQYLRETIRETRKFI